MLQVSQQTKSDVVCHLAFLGTVGVLQYLSPNTGGMNSIPRRYLTPPTHAFGMAPIWRLG